METEGIHEAGDDAASEKIQDEIRRLDKEYRDLEAKEQLLIEALRRLEQDEKCLKKAIDEAEQDPRQVTSKRSNDEAIRRLQQALMASSSSDEDDNKDDSVDQEHAI